MSFNRRGASYDCSPECEWRWWGNAQFLLSHVSSDSTFWMLCFNRYEKFALRKSWNSYHLPEKERFPLRFSIYVHLMQYRINQSWGVRTILFWKRNDLLIERFRRHCTICQSKVRLSAGENLAAPADSRNVSSGDIVAHEMFAFIFFQWTNILVIFGARIFRGRFNNPRDCDLVLLSNGRSTTYRGTLQYPRDIAIQSHKFIACV